MFRNFLSVLFAMDCLTVKPMEQVICFINERMMHIWTKNFDPATKSQSLAKNVNISHQPNEGLSSCLQNPVSSWPLNKRVRHACKVNKCSEWVREVIVQVENVKQTNYQITRGYTLRLFTRWKRTKFPQEESKSWVLVIFCVHILHDDIPHYQLTNSSVQLTTYFCQF